MKKIGNALAKFFGAIWGWIKNTAWVQPLLIVGLIFAVIFSIKPITNTVSDMLAQNNAPNLYRDTLMADTEVRSFREDIKEKKNRGHNGDGNFVVFYVQYLESTCTHCEELEPYFKTYFTSSAGLDVVKYTIDIAYFDDEYDDDYCLDEEEGDEILAEIEDFVSDHREAPTLKLMFTDKELQENLDSGFFATFQTPTIVKYQNYEITDIMFGGNAPTSESDITGEKSLSHILDTFFSFA